MNLIERAQRVIRLEAEAVAVEAEGRLGVGVREEVGVNGDVHARHASRAGRPGLLDS